MEMVAEMFETEIRLGRVFDESKGSFERWNTWACHVTHLCNSRALLCQLQH